MGYPVVVRQAAPRMAGFSRPYGRRGLGQHWYSGILNAAENIAGGLPINAPEAGGGFVTAATPNPDNSQTIRYVDSSGNAAIMTVPANPDGSPPTPAQLQAAVNATGAGTTPPVIPSNLPSWVMPAVITVAAVLGLTVLYGVYRGVKG